MKNIFILNKKEGETPLELLNSFRYKKSKLDIKYINLKMTYAGRLDPMASGLLLVLAGEEIKNKERYLSLNKEYVFEILFGVSTDTYDILGKIVRQDLATKMERKELENKIKENLKYFIGEFSQKYPPYSSKTVKGKQLFQYAREDLEVERPERVVFVTELKFFKLKKINKDRLMSNIEKRIKKVNGDFRQQEILKIWHKKLYVKHSVLDKQFFIGNFKIKCSSGTYVRGIANSLGEKIGIPTLAFSIQRTRIGKFKKME